MKICKLIYSEWKTDYKGSCFSMKDFLLPNNNYSEKANKFKDDDSVVRYSIDFKWEINNITEAVFDLGDMDKFIETTHFEYDKKRNPFYQALQVTEGFHSFFNASENNIIKATVTIEQDIEETLYEYTYEGKYPIEKRVKGEGDTDWVKDAFYEYL